MIKRAIIYLHGFNSASRDSAGHLLVKKAKLAVLQAFCAEQGVQLYAPNVDYRDFAGLIEDCLYEYNQLLDQGFSVVFMGSSMGGFASEYLAMKTGRPAIMINPAIAPSCLLPTFIGVTTHYETGAPYDWQLTHCQPYAGYEAELLQSQRQFKRLILLDLGDELLDAEQTQDLYRDRAEILSFSGGSHAFEHMREALPAIGRVVSE